MPKRRRVKPPAGKWDKNRHRIKEGATPELIRHRLALVGATMDGEGRVRGPDPALSEYPLGVLLARKMITEREHLAGQIFAGLRAAAIGGMVHPQVMAWKRLVPTALDADTLPDSPREARDETEEEKENRIGRAFTRADLALRHAGIGPRNAVKSVACYFQAPKDGLQALKIGLATLADHWRIRDEQARRAA